MNYNLYFETIIICIVLFFIIGIYVFWLEKSNKKQSKWGVNFKSLSHNLLCPECGAIILKTRTPENLRQILWGGFTCKSCGNEYDKWLNKIK